MLFFLIFVLVEAILLFKLAPKCGAEVVWYSQAQEGCDGTWEKTPVLDEFCSGIFGSGG